MGLVMDLRNTSNGYLDDECLAGVTSAMHLQSSATGTHFGHRTVSHTVKRVSLINLEFIKYRYRYHFTGSVSMDIWDLPCNPCRDTGCLSKSNRPRPRRQRYHVH
jgi:hypothetical protein